MENQINAGLRPTAAELGALQETEKAVRFFEAYRAWILGERNYAPTAEAFGITDQKAGQIAQLVLERQQLINSMHHEAGERPPDAGSNAT